MLADKTILASTLFVAFASGGAVGYSLNGGQAADGRNPYAARMVFKEQITELRTKGYEKAELDEAVDAYTRYLVEYQKWWDSFAESHAANLDLVDERLRERLAEIEARYRTRSGGPDSGDTDSGSEEK